MLGATSLLTSTVGWITAALGLALLALVLGAGLWALRRHSRMFPDGFDRTGWQPEPGRAGRFETMWTYFSGGRGGTWQRPTRDHGRQPQIGVPERFGTTSGCAR